MYLVKSPLYLDKSPLTFIYFTTFEKKSQVSPTHTTKLFGFWYNNIHMDWLTNVFLKRDHVIAKHDFGFESHATISCMVTLQIL